MPAYKSAKTIEKSIKSVLSQSYTDLELIVVVDGMSDATYEICRPIQDTRRRVYVKETGGGGGAVCFGMSMASGCLRKKTVIL